MRGIHSNCSDCKWIPDTLCTLTTGNKTQSITFQRTEMAHYVNKSITPLSISILSHDT
jgi:hypothetical protein